MFQASVLKTFVLTQQVSSFPQVGMPVHCKSILYSSAPLQILLKIPPFGKLFEGDSPDFALYSGSPYHYCGVMQSVAAHGGGFETR